MTTDPPNPISIVCANGSVKAQPETRNVPFGTFTIRWIPSSNVQVESITFDDSKAPFSPPAKDPTTGEWTSVDTNDNQTKLPQPWSYTIVGTCTGSAPIAVDPEIVNDPKGGLEDEHPGGKGKTP